MSLHIIIDGYNLIRQSHYFRRIESNTLERARDTLISKLSEYKKIKRHKITIVFDGTNAPNFFSMTGGGTIKGIGVKFSRPGEEADAVIKRMAAYEREKALIVSSDNEIVHYVEEKGAATIPSHEFEDVLTFSMYMAEKGIDTEKDECVGWKPTTKKKGPRRRLSKRMRKNKARIKKL